MLVVEDGTGKSDANSYASIVYVDSYHANRGNSKWEVATLPDREAAAIRATDYIDKRWGVRFRGRKGSSSQSLQFPRIDIRDNNGYSLANEVPVPLLKAHAEYSLRALLNNVLAPDPAQTVPQQNHEDGSTVTTEVVTGEITEKSEKVGPIEEKTVYRPAGINRTTRAATSALVTDASIQEYPEADLWLEELTMSTTSVRAVRG